MTKLVWDQSGARTFETGVDKGVLYPIGTLGTYPLGVAWNGLVSVSESPSGAEANPQYADNIKYLELRSAEVFGATVEAFTYPDEFAECDGSVAAVPGLMLGQQSRKAFGLAYCTKVGNDVDGEEHGYKIHLIYGAHAAPSERQYQTINDSPEAITFSWELTTVPVEVANHKPTSYLVVDSTKVGATQLAALETILYGVTTPTSVAPRLPLPAEVITLFTA
jgi:hypothetical protein